MSEEIESLEEELEQIASKDSENTKKQPNNKKRLTMQEWEEIKALWESGSVTLDILSKRYGVSRDAIFQRLKKDGIKKGARAAEAAEKMRDNLEEDMTNNVAVLMERIRETKENHYLWSAALGKLVMQEILNAKQNKVDFGLKDANLAALNKAAKTLEIIRKERYTLLGLDTEDGDPEEMDELMISVLTPEQIEQMQAEMRQSNPDYAVNLDVLTEEDNDIVSEGD